MNTVLAHYDSHLARHYTWMFGGFSAAVKNFMQYFSERKIKFLPNKLCVDLGCGSGFQSVALAKMGFEVKAIDFSEVLLEELAKRKENLNIETINDDILNFPAHLNEKPALIICMGDTLTHLNAKEDVSEIIKKVPENLAEGGKFIISYRDLSQPLSGAGRFIPVRSDDSKILTCFLEYNADFVEVFDILYLKNGDKWHQQVSSYKKLLLPETWVKEQLLSAGFTVAGCETIHGMKHIIAASA